MLVASCTRETGAEFARTVFPELEFDGVLASKLRHKGGHGCTYVVLRLRQDAGTEPPTVVPQWAAHNFEQEGAWRRSPVEVPGARMSCLVDDSDRLDGAQIEGYGPEILKLITMPGAWVSIYGRGEGQVLMLYAPDARLAFHLRFGD